jgi:hypothetical protein
MTLFEALEHALTCPLAVDAYRVMRGKPEQLTACTGCREMLIAYRDLEPCECPHPKSLHGPKCFYVGLCGCTEFKSQSNATKVPS